MIWQGLLSAAEEYLDKAYEMTGNVGLLIRKAIMLPPMVESSQAIGKS